MVGALVDGYTTPVVTIICECVVGDVGGGVGTVLVLACCAKPAAQGGPPELHGAGEQFDLQFCHQQVVLLVRIACSSCELSQHPCCLWV